jgi:hypothetical protein
MLRIVTGTEKLISQLSIKWEEHSSTWISQDILGISLRGQSSNNIVMLMVYLISQANATTAASILYYTFYSQQITRLLFLPILLNKVEF